MTRLQKSDDTWLKTPGTWRGAIAGDVRTATASCPKCGKVASLSGHTIDDAGQVTPSLVCPYLDCDFHEYIQLEGWTP